MALFNYECDEVKRIIDEVSPNYPQLTTYEKEWLYFHKYGYIAGIPVDLEYETVTVNPYGSVLNAIPFNYKSAILKGNTKLVSANGQKFDSYFTINDKLVKGKGIDDFTGDIKESSSDFATIDLLPLPKPPFIITGNSSWKKIAYYDKDKQFIESKRALEGDIVVDENPSNAKYCRFGYNNTEIDASFKLLKSDGSDLDYPNLELISVKKPVLTTTNEDGTKTNILTVNEDIELRGIDDVKDELNLLTGKLTQRIKEVVLNGSENWMRSVDFSSLTNTVHFQIQSDTVGLEADSPLISDKFINRALWANDIEGIYCAPNGNLAISINRNKLSGLEVADFKQWLSQNNVTVIGKSTESIKTVDLTPLNKPYEGTNHYQLTSNIPCETILEVPVVSTGEQTLQEINND